MRSERLSNERYNPAIHRRLDAPEKIKKAQTAHKKLDSDYINRASTAKNTYDDRSGAT